MNRTSRILGVVGILAILAAVALLLLLRSLLGSNAGSSASASSTHMVYTEMNQSGGNRIAIYRRTSVGGLAWVGAVASGGHGIGILPDTAGALALSQDGHWLLAVNSGSDSVSAFAIARDGSLRLTGTASSGGIVPNSVTVHNQLVYVLNPAGDLISGLSLGPNGTLTPLPGSARYTGGGLGAEIRFSPAGDTLVVTNRQNNTISSFHVDGRGLLHGPLRARSPVPGPYGFAFTPSGTLVVADAAISFETAGERVTPGGAAASSYRVTGGGSPRPISTVRNGQSLACWAAISRDGRYAWTSNFGIQSHGLGSISSFRLDGGGRLSLLKNTAALLDQRGARHGNEMTISRDGRYLYVTRVDADPPLTKVVAINAYRIRPDGSLQLTGTVSGLPGSDTGLVAR